MDLSSISGAYTAIKAAKDALGSAVNAKAGGIASEQAQTALEQMGEAQDKLFWLREELARLQDENSELKDRVKSIESWEERFRHYELTQTSGGAHVYRFNGEPEHYACPRCAERREVQILQDTRTMSGNFMCPGCDSQFAVKPAKQLKRRRTTGF